MGPDMQRLGNACVLLLMVIDTEDRVRPPRSLIWRGGSVGRDTESLINAVRGLAGTVRQSQCSKGCSNPSHMLFPVWRELSANEKLSSPPY